MQGITGQLTAIWEGMVKHEDLLERGDIVLLQKYALRIPDAKYKPLLHQNYFNKEGDGSEMGMKHNRIS